MARDVAPGPDFVVTAAVEVEVEVEFSLLGTLGFVDTDGARLPDGVFDLAGAELDVETLVLLAVLPVGLGVFCSEDATPGLGRVGPVLTVVVKGLETMVFLDDLASVEFDVEALVLVGFCSEDAGFVAPGVIRIGPALAVAVKGLETTVRPARKFTLSVVHRARPRKRCEYHEHQGVAWAA